MKFSEEMPYLIENYEIDTILDLSMAIHENGTQEMIIFSKKAPFISIYIKQNQNNVQLY